MATATRRLLTRHPAWLVLREERGLSFAPLSTGSQRVDRERGIIFGVRVLGPDSPNNHNSGATKGTVYTLECHEKAVPDLEGMKVNVNHPPRPRPGETLQQDRPAEQGLGKISNVRHVENTTYADLHCLKSHSMWPLLAEAAEREDEGMSDNFSLSINAQGRGDVIDGKFVVYEIKNIQSVDVVRDGGSNSGLFESREPPMLLSIRKLFEAARPAIKVGKRPKLAALMHRLLEDDEMGVMGADTGMDEAPKDHEQALSDGFEAACTAIIRKCLQDGEDPAECSKKISKMLKAHGKLTASDQESEDMEEEGQDGQKKEDGDVGTEKQKEDEKKAMEESRKRVTRLARGFLALRESEAPPPKLIEALVALPTEEARLNLLESWPRGGGVSGDRGGRAPVGVGPDGGRGGSTGKLTLKDVARAVRG